MEPAANGLSERDNHPMPGSVTTPEAFYKVMACAALDAIGSQAFLKRVARAERKLRISGATKTRADAKLANAYRRR